ncbi:hypothetical protein ACP716_26500 [Klebsiella pneumoniae]
MQLFHGTRQRFEKFDVSFMGTGEAGEIPACWFTDNFKGARHHALRVNHNPGQALVYQCGLKPGAIIADYSKPLIEQPAVYDRLIAGLPVIISSNLSTGRDWHLLNSPYYGNHKGRVWYQGIRGKGDATIINLFRKCGIHGVHDWELHTTDAHYQGPTIVIFNTEVLEIQDIVEVNY